MLSVDHVLQEFMLTMNAFVHKWHKLVYLLWSLVFWPLTCCFGFHKNRDASFVHKSQSGTMWSTEWKGWITRFLCWSSERVMCSIFQEKTGLTLSSFVVVMSPPWKPCNENPSTCLGFVGLACCCNVGNYETFAAVLRSVRDALKKK